MRSDDDLKKIARGVKSGGITLSTDVENEDTLSVFRSMRDVTLGELEQWEKDDIRLIFEWNNNKVSVDEDGSPVFDTYEFLTHEEHDRIKEEIKRIDETTKKRNAKKRKSRKSKK